MREIEIKAQVSDKDRLIAALEQKGGALSEPIKQHDEVWYEPGAPIGTIGKNVLRIRNQNDTTTIFTLKQTVAALDKIEHESEVADAEQMRAIIELMHYIPYSNITKIRRKTHVGDTEVCVDDVEGLGLFIEAEKLCANDSDGDAVREELWHLFNELGISKDDQVTKGYDVLMHELGNT